jgi:hypothetical protein
MQIAMIAGRGFADAGHKVSVALADGVAHMSI